MLRVPKPEWGMGRCLQRRRILPESVRGSRYSPTPAICPTVVPLADALTGRLPITCHNLSPRRTINMPPPFEQKRAGFCSAGRRIELEVVSFHGSSARAREMLRTCAREPVGAVRRIGVLTMLRHRGAASPLGGLGASRGFCATSPLYLGAAPCERRSGAFHLAWEEYTKAITCADGRQPEPKQTPFPLPSLMALMRQPCTANSSGHAALLEHHAGLTQLARVTVPGACR